MSKIGPSVEINLHHEGEIAALADQFESVDPDQAHITVLAAVPGEGRRYLLRQAVAESRRRGRQVLATEIDLDGAEVEKLSLQSYWEFQKAKRDRSPSAAAQSTFERLAGRSPTPGLTELSLAAALAGLDADSDALADRIAAALADPEPWSSLAAGLDGEDRVIVHCVDTSELPAPLRRLLLEVAMEAPRLKALISSHRNEGVGKVVRGRPNARFEVMPLDRGELESTVERLLESPGAPAAAYDRLFEQTGGGLGATSRAVSEWAAGGVIAPRDTGGWRWSTEGDGDFRDLLDAALADVDDEARRLLASFAHLAAFCGDNVPVKRLLSFLNVGEDELDDVIDQIDETLGSDSEAGLFADRFQHPSMPGELVYGFRDGAIPYALRAGLTDATRQRLAMELVQALARETPLSTRAAVRMLAEICRHAGADQNRQELERELAWRVGEPDVEMLQRAIVEEVRGGHLPVAVVWKAVNEGQLRWPPYRTLAVVDALAQVIEPQALPPAFFAIRSAVLLHLDRNADALDAAQAGLDRDSEDKLLNSALWERLGAAQQRLGQESDAAQSFEQSRGIQTDLLEAGDTRVVPIFEQAARALEAGGSAAEAAELRKKIQYYSKQREEGQRQEG